MIRRAFHTGLLAAALSGASFFAFAGTAMSADITPRLASVAPEGTPWLESMKRYEAAVEAASGGAIDVQLYPAGQLGDELQSLAQIRRGRIEGGFVSSAALSTIVPELSVIESPFLWSSAEELDYVVDNALFEAMRPLFAEKGLILVDVLEVGWIHLLAAKPLAAPADVKGMKPRAVETKASMGFWERLGANPVALPYTDVLSSLQTGLVNGTDNDLVSMFFAGFYKSANNLTLTNHSYNLGALVLSKTVL
jgi:TRAP-type transport system periplasmic protein